MLSFEDFRKQYDKTGIVPLAMSKRTKPLSEEALNREYHKYILKGKTFSIEA